MDKKNNSLPKKYIDLVRQYPLLCIKSNEEENAVKNRVKSLLDLYDLEGELTPGQEDYLRTLNVLLSAYQSNKNLVPDLYGTNLLKVLIEERQLRQKDLVEKKIFKTESIVSEILKGKRQLTVEYIKKLSDYFKCSPSAFFQRDF